MTYTGEWHEIQRLNNLVHELWEEVNRLQMRNKELQGESDWLAMRLDRLEKTLREEEE